MSASDELEAQAATPQSWFGPGQAPPAGVPVNDLTAPAASARPEVKAADLPLLPPVPAKPEGESAPPVATKPPEEQERLQALIASYEREAKAIGHDPRAAALYLEIGRIWEEQLGKQRNAAMCYQRAFHLAPKNLAVLHASRRLFTEVGNWGMVVQIVQAEIEATEDVTRRANLLAEKGTILEQKLKNDEEAQLAFREAIELSPADPLAIESLEQIYLQRGDHPALFQLYVRAVESSDAPDRKLDLLRTAAQLAEDRLGDGAGAMTLYTRALELSPQHPGALAALRRLSAANERWDVLVDALERSAAAATSDAERVALLIQAARVQQDRLGATDKALLTLMSGLERASKDLSLLHEIEWLYQANGKHDEVAKVLRFEIDATADVPERATLMVRLAALHEERLGQPVEAISALEEALKLVPGLKAAFSPLARLYEKTGRWEPLARLFEQELTTVSMPPSARASRLYKAAELYEAHLSRDADAARALAEVLALTPGYPPALKGLERLYHKGARWPELLALYEQEVEITQDVEHRVFVWGLMGELLEHKLELPDRAVAVYQQILAARPGHLGAIRTLERLHEKRANWVDLLGALELEVDATSDPAEVVGILHTIGRVQEERLGELERAIATYEKVLTLSPGYQPALQSLGRLYQREGRWEPLIAMHRREIAVSSSDEHTLELRYRIAEIAQESLQDDARAVAVYDEILAKDPGERVALDALAEIYRRTGDFEHLAETVAARALHCSDPNEKQQLLSAVADLHEHKLGRSEQGAELNRALSGPSAPAGVVSTAANESLIRFHTARKEWPAVLAVLEGTLAQLTESGAKARTLVRISEVAGDALGSAERAVEALEQAQALAPDDVEVLRALERLYLARRDWPRAVAVSEKVVAFEHDPRQYAARQIRLGTLKESELAQPEAAATHYLRALEKIPGHPIALRSLEVAYRRAGAWDGVAALYQREALLAGDADRRANLFYRAGDVFEHQLRRDDLALPMYKSSLEASGPSVPAIRALARIAERKGDGAAALEMLRMESSSAADPERTLQLLVEQGEIYQDKVGDMPQAIEAFTQVLARAPQHTKAFHRLETIYSSQGASAPLVHLLVTRAQSIDSLDDQADLYLQAGRVAQDELKDHERAVVLYREVLERKPMHPKALQRIGPLFVEVQDWSGALEAFHKLVSVTTESVVRAQGFRALGTIYEERKEDLVKAVQAYQHAVQADPTDADSLSRLARVYKSAQDWGSAVNVLLRLVEVQVDPAQRIATLVELGQIYETFGDLENASLALQKAVEIDPANIAVILRLADLYERAGNWRMLGQVADQFSRALPPAERRRALPLQLKMAEVYEQRLGDDGKAANELRSALELDPLNAGALAMLARLYGKSASTFPQAIDVHRRLLRVDPFRVDSYHEMFRLFSSRKEFDKAFVCAEILVFLRAQRQDEDVFFQQNKENVNTITDAVLSADDHDRLVVHPEERGAVRWILEILGLELFKAYPGDLAKYELNARTDKHGPKSDLTVRKTADLLAKVLGAPQYDLWITKKFELSWFLENEEVPALVMGAGLQRRTGEREMKFFLARQLERLKSGQQMWATKEGFKIPALELEFVVLAAAKLAKPDLKVDRDPVELDVMSKKLAKHLSRKGRKALDDLAPRLTTVRMDPERHRWASIHTANRAGLVLANEIESTIRAIARDAGIRLGFADANAAREALGVSPEVKELLCYAVSEEYFAARTKLKFSIQP